jgi:hypothetical protein
MQAHVCLVTGNKQYLAVDGSPSINGIRDGQPRITRVHSIFGLP